MASPTKIPAKALALAGLLGALALLLAFLEGQLPPMPLLPPGAKPGLSNLVTMFAAGALGLPHALFITLIKGGFALFTRGATAGLMSLFGGSLSALCTYVLLRKTGSSYILIGILGAVAHNFGQLLVSLCLMGPVVVVYIPALLFFALISGAATGFLLWLLYARLARLLPILCP